jgi:hypothetical protein
MSTEPTQPQHNQKPPARKAHRWSPDGETCLDCGDKDWRASSNCEPTQPAPLQPEPQQSAVEWVKKLLCDGTDLEGNDLAFLLEDNALELARAIDDLRAQLAALRSKQPQP